ncbi:capsid portal protein [Gallid alphaherpesvirus 1]|uniref:Capsid portal protein n=1 Tax=Infectious laryngotracheitis virus TaxID=10386 RepID=A0A0K0K5V4_ILTV|nr:capsid portal protein [Gallid alphaherpesvirus 1]
MDMPFSQLRQVPCAFDIDNLIAVLEPILTGEPDDWIIIHPTKRTMGFREILLGASTYTSGQGVYNSVRATESVVRQIQVAVLRNILDGCRFEDVERDWDTHIRTRGLTPDELAARYCHNSEDGIRVAEQAFELWSFLLQTVLLDFVRGVSELSLRGLSEAGKAPSYVRYIDWITCLGMVPLVRERKPREKRPTGSDLGNEDLESTTTEIHHHLHVAPSLFARGFEMLKYLRAVLGAVHILEYERTLIIMNVKTSEIRAYDGNTGELGECMVVWEPLVTDRGVLFDSPMQRLHGPVLKAQAMREHAKLCQLVNTAPIKVLLGLRTENAQDPDHVTKVVDKALGEGVEEAGTSAAARLIKFIIDIQNMRKVGDVADVVDSYLRENVSNIERQLVLDPTRVGCGGRAAAQGQRPIDNAEDRMGNAVRAAVNTSVGKVVNTLFKTVSDLKESNKNLVYSNGKMKKELVEARMESARRTERTQANYDRCPAWETLGGIEEAWECKETLESLSKLPENLSYNLVDVSKDMNDQQYIANSFLARYIPPYLEEETRLSALWEQELLRVFKIQRNMNNQGEEVSLSYSTSAITLIVGPFFHKVLKASRLGFLVSSQTTYKSEEELCQTLFASSRVGSYLKDLNVRYIANVRRSCANRQDERWDGRAERDRRAYSRGSDRESADSKVSIMGRRSIQRDMPASEKSRTYTIGRHRRRTRTRPYP